MASVLGLASSLETSSRCRKRVRHAENTAICLVCVQRQIPTKMGKNLSNEFRGVPGGSGEFRGVPGSSGEFRFLVFI